MIKLIEEEIKGLVLAADARIIASIQEFHTDYAMLKSEPNAVKAKPSALKIK